MLVLGVFGCELLSRVYVNYAKSLGLVEIHQIMKSSFGVHVIWHLQPDARATES